ncbi:MAG: TetR family transcriptional regulator, partial [Thermoleophilia bacterium]|nr:TetR family transcriptional regulator [Thermoleophilia bacterium]
REHATEAILVVDDHDAQWRGLCRGRFHERSVRRSPILMRSDDLRNGPVPFCATVKRVNVITDTIPVRGRPRDASRDEVICRAALELLAERGYDCITMDLVASRAKAGKATLYRRWASKAELVMDALALVKPSIPSIDTGSLETDLAALVDIGCSKHSSFTSSVMCGVASALGRDPELLACFRERITEPRIARIREVLERAQARGEIAADVDVVFASSIVPSLTLQRALLTGAAGDRAYVQDIVAKVLRPMLGLSRGSSTATAATTAPPTTASETP